MYESGLFHEPPIDVTGNDLGVVCRDQIADKMCPPRSSCAGTLSAADLSFETDTELGDRDPDHVLLAMNADLSHMCFRGACIATGRRDLSSPVRSVGPVARDVRGRLISAETSIPRSGLRAAPYRPAQDVENAQCAHALDDLTKIAHRGVIDHGIPHLCELTGVPFDI